MECGAYTLNADVRFVPARGGPAQSVKRGRTIWVQPYTQDADIVHAVQQAELTGVFYGLVVFDSPLVVQPDLFVIVAEEFERLVAAKLIVKC